MEVNITHIGFMVLGAVIEAVLIAIYNMGKNKGINDSKKEKSVKH